MSLKTAEKCLETSPDPQHHMHAITLPKRLRRHPPASKGYRGLERVSEKFRRYMKQLEDNEQHLLRAREHQERYNYHRRHAGCRRYTEDAQPYFTRGEWTVACAEATERLLDPPEGNKKAKKMYIYE